MELTKIFLMVAIIAMASASSRGKSDKRNNENKKIGELENQIVEYKKELQNSQCRGHNMAFQKQATQSSLIDKYGYASHAVDGALNGNWYRSTCTGTKYEMNPWWQVDLGKKQYFTKIVIQNRADCCGNRLANFDVKVEKNNGTEWKTVLHYAPAVRQGEGKSFTLNETYARYVRIQLRGTNVLTLCEVEVFE